MDAISDDVILLCEYRMSMLETNHEDQTFLDTPARLVIRRSAYQDELYAHFYRSPEPDAGEVIMQGSLEGVVQAANILMWEEFGSCWEGDEVISEVTNIPRSGSNGECHA